MARACVSGILSSRLHGEQVVQRLRNLGVGRDELSVVFGHGAPVTNQVGRREDALRDIIATGPIGWLEGPTIISTEDHGPLIVSGALAQRVEDRLDSILDFGCGLSPRQRDTLVGAVANGRALVVVETEDSEVLFAVRSMLNESGVESVSAASAGPVGEGRRSSKDALAGASIFSALFPRWNPPPEAT